MSRAIIVIVDEGNEEIFLDLTRPFFVDYAQKCKAELIELFGDIKKSSVLPYSQQYDRIIFARPDILIKKEHADLFDQIADDKIGISYMLLCSLESDMGYCKTVSGSKFLPWTLNTGLLVASKQHDIWRDYPSDEEWAKSLQSNQLQAFATDCQPWIDKYEDLSRIMSLVHFYGIENKYKAIASIIGVKQSKIESTNEPIRNSQFNKSFIQDIDLDGSKTFVTKEMIAEDSIKLLEKLPKIGGVVGCPRSGLIPASIIAVALSIPLYSVDGDVLVKLNHMAPNGGGRMRNYIEDKNLPILIIDDTVFYGTQMKEMKKLIRDKMPDRKIITACIYCYTDSRNHPDYYVRGLSYPHILEWNFFNCSYIKNSYIDFDGILCPDVPAEIDNDEEKYKTYIATVKPIKSNIPSLFKCSAICTGRLEKYRDLTERWLERHNVQYNNLIMFPGTKEQRDRNHAQTVGRFKAEKLSESNCSFFIESCDFQSQIIAKELQLLHKQGIVICPNSKKVY